MRTTWIRGTVIRVKGQPDDWYWTDLMVSTLEVGGIYVVRNSGINHSLGHRILLEEVQCPEV